MSQNKIRIDRILASILIIILSSSLIMFAIRLLVGTNYKKASEFTYIIKESSTLEAEKVIIATLLSDTVNLENVSEEVKAAYNEKKNALIQVNSEEKGLDVIKPVRKEFELLVYDIKKTQEIVSKEKKNMRVEKGVHYINQFVIVNKKYALPETYNPKENPEAKNSFLKLINKMQQENLSISNDYAGYRDFVTQKTLYNEVFKKEGKKVADATVLRAGHSEYQTGLAFSLLNRSGSLLGSIDEDAKAVEWIVNNAHLYGFVVRYPQGKEEVTGVKHQPHMIRFVGEELANQVFDSQKTLEEFFDFEGGDYIE